VSVRDEAEERRLVEVLRPYQLAKLERDRGKGHWGDEDLRSLLRKLRVEVNELSDALSLFELNADAADAVACEAADVANFVAMIADVVLSRKERA
jgi:NTP pyrophosphatase (non-canonical NTP hydrolase)